MKKFSFTIKRNNKTIYTFVYSDDYIYHFSIYDDMLVIKELDNTGECGLIFKFCNCSCIIKEV